MKEPPNALIAFHAERNNGALCKVCASINIRYHVNSFPRTSNSPTPKAARCNAPPPPVAALWAQTLVS